MKGAKEENEKKRIHKEPIVKEVRQSFRILARQVSDKRCWVVNSLQVKKRKLDHGEVVNEVVLAVPNRKAGGEGQLLQKKHLKFDSGVQQGLFLLPFVCVC